ncbi:hypothetical protein G6F45_014235 [Rhizopus arrhizus]|nr:hypothetical protein G6F45_014235 [Rhizopus arrhizus]
MLHLADRPAGRPGRAGPGACAHLRGPPRRCLAVRQARGHHARPEDRAPAGAVLDRRPGQQIADVQAAHGRRVP